MQKDLIRILAVLILIIALGSVFTVAITAKEVIPLERFIGWVILLFVLPGGLIVLLFEEQQLGIKVSLLFGVVYFLMSLLTIVNPTWRTTCCGTESLIVGIIGVLLSALLFYFCFVVLRAPQK